VLGHVCGVRDDGAMRVRAAWLIEGVRIDGPARMAPLSLSPISLDRGYVGREARGIFNAELADAGFVTAVERPIWGAQIAPYRRLVSVISDELDLDGLAEVGALTSLAANAANVLAVIWGGAPEVIAGATELWDDRHGGWRTLSVSAGGGAWQSSIVRKLLPDGAVLEDDDPGELWAASGSDPRIPLWLSLFRGLSGERAWDRRVFRACSLLETIACEAAPYRSEVVDRDGDVLLDREGRVATTEQSRGKIHWTVQRSLVALGLPDALVAAHPSRTLWAEVGVWYDVRNAVAHEGYWAPPPLPTRRENRRDEVAEAFEVAAAGDGLDTGWLRYSDKSCAAVEIVLRAALHGQLVGDPV
jgi:hypothetical protein